MGVLRRLVWRQPGGLGFRGVRSPARLRRWPGRLARLFPNPLFEVGKGLQDVGDDVARSRELADFEHGWRSPDQPIDVLQQGFLRVAGKRPCEQV
jgi:hypothetical protein